MNKLILEILPDIQETAKKISRVADQQNELTQYVILECYRYEEVVKRLHNEKRLKTWIYTAIKREHVRMKKNIPTDQIKDAPDEPYEDLLAEFSPFLSSIEREWLKRYIQEGSYKNLERRTKIQRKYISQRIKTITEKCKKLKSTLF